MVVEYASCFIGSTKRTKSQIYLSQWLKNLFLVGNCSLFCFHFSSFLFSFLRGYFLFELFLATVWWSLSGQVVIGVFFGFEPELMALLCLAFFLAEHKLFVEGQFWKGCWTHKVRFIMLALNSDVLFGVDLGQLIAERLIWMPVRPFITASKATCLKARIVFVTAAAIIWLHQTMQITNIAHISAFIKLCNWRGHWAALVEES